VVFLLPRTSTVRTTAPSSKKRVSENSVEGLLYGLALNVFASMQCDACEFGRRDFAQMRVRILLNAMVEAKSWVLRAKNGAGVKYVEHPASGRVSRRGNEVSMFRILGAEYVQIAPVF
jgi:hypothetical protein